MTFARALWADLVEKRLWPVAVLLVVALVGVPIALSSMGGDDAPPPPLPALAAGDVAAAAAQPVVVDTSVPTSAPRGRYNDPFTGGPRASAPAAAAAPRSGSASASSGSASASSGHASASSGGQASASSGGHSSGPAAAGPPAAPVGAPRKALVPQPAPTTSGFAAGYTVDVHWTGVPHRDLVRRARLMMSNGMGIVFVGVRHHGDRALFLLSPGLTTIGEGRCVPSPAACQMIELRKGDYELFDVVREGFPPVRYGLRLDRLAPARAPTRLAARRVLSRVSRAGTKLVSQIVDAGRTYVTEFRYAQALGLLVKRADLRPTRLAPRDIPATAPESAPTGQ